MKIGIFGGSFNPIHNGHLSMSKYLIENNLVERVWIMPCKIHPLNKKVINERLRVDMIKLALEGTSGVEICDYELKKQGTSYTYQTLRELKKEYNHDFRLVIGSDILNQMYKWHGLEHLQKEAKFFVFKRSGYEIYNPGLNIEKIIEWDGINASSTEIKKRIKENKSISDLVPKSVEKYILENKLYT